MHNKLGCGFLEKVYHNALLIELTNRNMTVEIEKRFPVEYEGRQVGEFFADMVVDGKVILEIKAQEKYNFAFEAQLLNYLKAANLEVGLIINFAHSVQVKRMVL